MGGRQAEVEAELGLSQSGLTLGLDSFSVPWQATVNKVDQVNSDVRRVTLELVDDQSPAVHLPGQYIDLHIPGIATVGGFTITSPPSTAVSSSSRPYIELAIQKSPLNPPAAYLWREPVSAILNAPVSFQIGGRFTYPPPLPPPPSPGKHECSAIDNAVFVAGGLGINPIMSMLAAMDERGYGGGGGGGGMVARVRVLYSSRRSSTDSSRRSTRAEPILFEDRLAALARKWRARPEVDYDYTLFETRGADHDDNDNEERNGLRIGHRDLLAALGPQAGWPTTVVYVCGVPQMTDDFVDFLRARGLPETRVLCEKWW